MQIIDFSKIEIHFFCHLKIKTRDHCDCRGNLRFFQFSLYIDAFLDQIEMIIRDFPDLRPVHERNNVVFVSGNVVRRFIPHGYICLPRKRTSQNAPFGLKIGEGLRLVKLLSC